MTVEPFSRSHHLPFGLLNPREKRKIFVSYHHENDQWYYNEFSRVFSEQYQVVQDNSVDRAVDSDDSDYVMRRIRENYITGTSCTFVLCGPETPFRKYIDWEIKATLDKEHGLIGVNLPNNPISGNGKFTVPYRIFDNFESNYALWLEWNSLIQGGVVLIKQQIELANSKPSSQIVNSRPMRQRNG